MMLEEARALCAEKRCGHCGITQPITEFYRLRDGSGRYLSWCKGCTSKRNRSVEGKEARRRYAQSAKGHTHLLQKQRENRQKHHERFLANGRINDALRDGKLSRPDKCSVCGSNSQLHAHHSDYSKRPVSVCSMWHVVLSEIQSGDRCFRLQRQIAPKLEEHNKLWVCEYEPLGLLGYGSSFDAAMQAFMDDFAVSYDGLVPEDNNMLTPGAQRLKKTLESLVYKVELWSGKPMDVEWLCVECHRKTHEALTYAVAELQSRKE